MMRMVWKAWFAAASLSVPLALTTVVLSAEPVMTSQTKGPAWQKVDNRKVCMVTDMVFPRDQIPVQVGKKIYYGCCENCKARLGEDEKVRFAIDPITDRKVDKATASIAAGPDGAVVYFENDASLEKFVALRKKADGPSK